VEAKRTAARDVIFTAGHSTRLLGEFLDLLEAQGVETAVDVRSYPSSKRFPWFGRELLAPALEKTGIDYVWMKDLGGRRRPAGGASPHTALSEGAFRSYADAMETPPFREAAGRLIDLARSRRTLLFCAEKDPERCHRRYLSDLLAVGGFEVVHLIDAKIRTLHVLHPDLIVREGRLVYSGGQGRLPFGSAGDRRSRTNRSESG